MRHCLDHFRCLLRGVDQGLIDYDARERDVDLERDRQKIGDALREVVEALNQLPSTVTRQRVRVRQTAAPGSMPTVCDSTVERELMFVSGHTIHHLALMDQIARKAGITIDERLTLAYSTSAYRAMAG
jgi:hypothetical protein